MLMHTRSPATAQAFSKLLWGIPNGQDPATSGVQLSKDGQRSFGA